MEISKDASVHSEANVGVGESISVANMDAALWSTLPKELIRLVCSRLPLPQLLKLQDPAKKGYGDINLDDSEFRRLCAQKHANMCATIVPEGGSRVLYNVEVHIGESILWSQLKLPIDEPEDVHRGRSNIMSQSDGGLVCFALKFKSPGNDESMVILVIKLLTGDCRKLPAHGMCPTQLKMMQLVIDRETKLYPVILVRHKSGSGGETEAMLCDSGSGVWANAKESPRLVFW